MVEDDWSIRNLISMRLGVLGFDVVEAADGASALSRLDEFRPHAMLLDINMPKMDGFEVMTRLGAAEMSRLPTLVLTARNCADDVKRAINLGARDYLAKPFAEPVLFSRVVRLFQRRPVVSGTS